MNVQEIMNSLEAKHPGEKEYLQAVHEVLDLSKIFTMKIRSIKLPKSLKELWNPIVF